MPLSIAHYLSSSCACPYEVASVDELGLVEQTDGITFGDYIAIMYFGRWRDVHTKQSIPSTNLSVLSYPILLFMIASTNSFTSL